MSSKTVGQHPLPRQQSQEDVLLWQVPSRIISGGLTLSTMFSNKPTTNWIFTIEIIRIRTTSSTRVPSHDSILQDNSLY